MTTAQHLIFISLVLGAASGTRNAEHTVPQARARLHYDFIKTLYSEISAAQVQNRANMIQIFTQGTLEQENEVAKYIQSTINSTKSEGNTLRMAGANSSTEITECVYQTELSILQVFLTTYDNFDNCVKSTQNSFQKLYNEINTKLENLKKDVASFYQHNLRSLSSCADSECVTRILVPSIIKYEMSREHLGNEIKAYNELNVNYLVRNIAMKCVTSSMGQIHHNSNIGKQMMTACFQKAQKQHNQNTAPINNYNQL